MPLPFAHQLLRKLDEAHERHDPKSRLCAEENGKTVTQLFVVSSKLQISNPVALEIVGAMIRKRPVSLQNPCQDTDAASSSLTSWIVLLAKSDLPSCVLDLRRRLLPMHRLGGSKC